MIAENLQHVRSKIASVCAKAGRNPEEIILVGITKYAEADKIQEALAAGLTHIGENRVQEAERKYAQVATPCMKHLVGHLQSNKVNAAIQFFDLIESVDRIKIARKIDKHAGYQNKTMDILVQVNTSGEEQKYGVAPEELWLLLEEIHSLKHLRLQGLMTIAPFTEEREIIRRCFRDLKNLFDEANEKLNSKMLYLSMGMSNDYDIALEEGANMLRIGRAIFQGVHT